ncbi:hypothetical protein NUU61_004781 [Penicillium alfredii]|uniref:Uncharacterized protein n=1 Tax=Penicillium alfredii TaxID=1506179 RepID=A0A9W9F8F1_9EURO|nr:uncharacterized protein NUU61_004781 [Penicillium alfredii]KAJ5095425.1 hypothetical protein NUU61_004781 [Penicillium alfredii]
MHDCVFLRLENRLFHQLCNLRNAQCIINRKARFFKGQPALVDPKLPGMLLTQKHIRGACFPFIRAYYQTWGLMKVDAAEVEKRLGSMTMKPPGTRRKPRFEVGAEASVG